MLHCHTPRAQTPAGFSASAESAGPHCPLEYPMAHAPLSGSSVHPAVKKFRPLTVPEFVPIPVFSIFASLSGLYATRGTVVLGRSSSPPVYRCRWYFNFTEVFERSFSPFSKVTGVQLVYTLYPASFTF